MSESEFTAVRPTVSPEDSEALRCRLEVLREQALAVHALSADLPDAAPVWGNDRWPLGRLRRDDVAPAD